MEIRSFFPLIMTADAESVMGRLEQFGFDSAHMKLGINEGKNDSVVMKDEAGHRVGVVATVKAPKPFIALAMNVANYAEAVAELEAQGYKNLSATGVNTGTSQATMLVSPEGVCVALSEHFKD